jgi:CubicO group peptidase (beta-lactamase class C family)
LLRYYGGMSGGPTSDLRFYSLSVLCIGAIALAVLCGCTPAPRPLDRQLRRLVEDRDAPLASLAVVVVADDRIVYEGYWGRRHIDAANPQHDRPVTAGTKFRVASLAKTVTAIGAMQLVEQGKLDLDADISRYLGFPLRNPNYPQRLITARMLLSHTSSLRDAGLYNLPAPYTLPDLFLPGGAYYDGGAHFSWPEGGADRGPGAYFTYANLNYGVLGTMMERISGERFDQYMTRHVLAPLGIDGGYTLGSLSDAGVAQLATIYAKQDAQGRWSRGGAWYPQLDDYNGIRPAPQPPLPGPPDLFPFDQTPRQGSTNSATTPTPPVTPPPYILGTNATLFSPHAGLRISARDLARVLLVLLAEGHTGDRQLLRPETVRRMLGEEWRYAPAAPNGDTGHGRYRAWGLGLQHSTATQDALGGDLLAPGVAGDYWGHRGEAYGFLGGMWFNPQRKIGFVYLIGGLGDDPYLHGGAYSSAYAWEETIQTALLAELARWELPVAPPVPPAEPEEEQE